MKIQVKTEETGNAYSIMEMTHQPNIGPAEHVHPRGNETFYIKKGSYTFRKDGTEIFLKTGDWITISKNTVHSYKSGSDGGEMFIIMPPDLEKYFWEVSQLEAKGIFSFEQERAIAAKYGQEFKGQSAHW